MTQHTVRSARNEQIGFVFTKCPKWYISCISLLHLTLRSFDPFENWVCFFKRTLSNNAFRHVIPHLMRNPQLFTSKTGFPFSREWQNPYSLLSNSTSKTTCDMLHTTYRYVKYYTNLNLECRSFFQKIYMIRRSLSVFSMSHVICRQLMLDLNLIL